MRYHLYIVNDGVVITGAGLVSSLGASAAETWEAVLAGKCGIRQVRGFDGDGFSLLRSAPVHGLEDAVPGVRPRDARIMDKHSWMLMKCTIDALRHAGLDTSSLRGEDVGFFAGIGMVDYRIEDLLPAVTRSADEEGGFDYNAFFSGGYQEIYPLWPLSMLNNISFCQVATTLGIKGENTVFSPHADSGIQAITEAVHSLTEKRSRIALAGGVSEKISPLSLARARLHGTLNTAEGGDGAACRPFGSERKGTVLGEGCGILVLELRSSAEKRRIPHSVMITGYGSAFGREDDAYCATSEAMSCSMDRALVRASVGASDIDVVIANGDGTRAGDRNEIEAIHHVFGECLGEMRVFSSKGALGHMLAGSPAVDIVLGTCMLEQGVVPQTINAFPLDSEARFRIVGKEPFKKDLRRVLITAGSCEGQCASLVLEKIEHH